jgi:hypothetical protein
MQESGDGSAQEALLSRTALQTGQLERLEVAWSLKPKIKGFGVDLDNSGQQRPYYHVNTRSSAYCLPLQK